MREWAIAIAIAGGLFALIFGVATHWMFRYPPPWAPGTTCWHYSPQPDITAPELAQILGYTRGGVILGKFGVRPDGETEFAPFKRHFTQIDCGEK